MLMSKSYEKEKKTVCSCILDIYGNNATIMALL